MYETLLLLTYVLIFGYLIRRLEYFKSADISFKVLGGIFLSKVLVGLAYGFIHKYQMSQGDTFLFFKESIKIANTFWAYPDYYIQSLLGNYPPVPDDEVFLYPPQHLFWKDLGTYTVVHFNAMLIPFSRGYYSVHIVFMAMLSLCAGLNFYRALQNSLQLPKILLIVGCFLSPSLLFWTAGVHKEVLLFIGFSWVVLGLVRGNIWGILAGIIGIGLVRHYAVVLLLPALLVYFVKAHKTNISFVRVLNVGSLAVVGVLLLDYLFFASTLQGILVQKQNAFVQELGHSDIDYVPPFKAVWEFCLYFPMAILHIFARPFIWEAGNIWQTLAALETLLFLGFIGLALAFSRKHVQTPPIAYFLAVFALSYLILIGLLVANEGTMVRYRAIPMSIFVWLVWYRTDWKAISTSLASIGFNKFKTYP
jgi:hypothetical protein